MQDYITNQMYLPVLKWLKSTGTKMPIHNILCGEIITCFGPPSRNCLMLLRPLESPSTFPKHAREPFLSYGWQWWRPNPWYCCTALVLRMHTHTLTLHSLMLQRHWRIQLSPRSLPPQLPEWLCNVRWLKAHFNFFALQTPYPEAGRSSKLCQGAILLIQRLEKPPCHAPIPSH